MAETIFVETPRLVLRRFTDRDREPFFALNHDPEVTRHLLGPLSRAESDDLVDRVNAMIDERGFSFFCVEEKASRECIGMLGLAVPRFEAHFTPCVEIGWRLARRTWGQGLATEGARACLAFGWERLRLDEIVSFTVQANERSWRVMERLGMTRAGEFDHPLIAEDHPLRRHVLYRIARP